MAVGDTDDGQVAVGTFVDVVRRHAETCVAVAVAHRGAGLLPLAQVGSQSEVGGVGHGDFDGSALARSFGFEQRGGDGPKEVGPA